VRILTDWYQQLEQAPEDFELKLVAADALWELGEEELSECLRWQGLHHRRAWQPYDGRFNWSTQWMSRKQALSALPPELFDVSHELYDHWTSLLQADQALARALRRLQEAQRTQQGPGAEAGTIVDPGASGGPSR